MPSSTALTAAPKLYEPKFNPDTNTYEDECPWVKGWRGPREPHKCFCNANVLFNTRSVFKQHIRSGKHKEALKDYNTGKDETKAVIKEFHIKIDQSERAKHKLAKENAKLKESIKEITTHTERQSVIISSLKEDVANNSAESAKHKTKHRKLKKKHNETTEYLEILETVSKEQLTTISELEAYIKIIEHKDPPQPQTPLSPPPPLSLASLSTPPRRSASSPPSSPPAAPRKTPKPTNGTENEDSDNEDWHDVSDEEDSP